MIIIIIIKPHVVHMCGIQTNIYAYVQCYLLYVSCNLHINYCNSLIVVM